MGSGKARMKEVEVRDALGVTSNDVRIEWTGKRWRIDPGPGASIAAPIYVSESLLRTPTLVDAVRRQVLRNLL